MRIDARKQLIPSTHNASLSADPQEQPAPMAPGRRGGGKGRGRGRGSSVLVEPSPFFLNKFGERCTVPLGTTDLFFQSKLKERRVKPSKFRRKCLYRVRWNEVWRTNAAFEAWCNAERLRIKRRLEREAAQREADSISGSKVEVVPGPSPEDVASRPPAEDAAPPPPLSSPAAPSPQRLPSTQPTEVEDVASPPAEDAAAAPPPPLSSPAAPSPQYLSSTQPTLPSTPLPAAHTNAQASPHVGIHINNIAHPPASPVVQVCSPCAPVTRSSHKNARATMTAPSPSSAIEAASPASKHLSAFLRAVNNKSTPEKARYLNQIFAHDVFSAGGARCSSGDCRNTFVPKHNNQSIDLSNPAIKGPVDERAYVAPSKQGDNVRSQGAARKEKSRCVRGIVDAVVGAGTISQQRLALRDALGHPKIRDVASSIGLNVEEVQVALYIKDNIKKMVAAIYENCKNSSNGSMNMDAHSFLNAISMSVVETPPTSPESTPTKPRGKQTTKISGRALKKHLNLASNGAAARSLKGAKKRRKLMIKGDRSALKTRPNHGRRSKYSEAELHKLRDWMLDNMYTRDSPMKDDSVRKRDLYDEYVFDGDKHQMIQKKLICVGPKELHKLMQKPSNQGGYADAFDGSGKVRYSLSTLIVYWPNWLVPMTERYKALCGCEACTISQDMQEDVSKARRELLKQLKKELEELPTRSREKKTRLEAKIKEYENEIMGEDSKPRHTRMWTACDALACPPIKVAGTELEVPHFKCVLGECKKCGLYEAPKMELESNKPVSYCLFSNYVACTEHGPKGIKQYDTAPKTRCTKCENMGTQEKQRLERKKKQPKIKSKRLRSKHVMPMKKFMAKGGIYEQQMKKMLLHKYLVKVMGKLHTTSSRNAEFEFTEGLLQFLRDHAEKWQPRAPNGQIQSEYYGQDVSVSIEGAIAKFIPLADNPEGLDSEKVRCEFFSSISDDKRQDGNTVYENIKATIRQLCKRGLVARKTVKVIMDIVDGCAAQYRSGTVLYFLSKLAFELGVIYDRAVQAPGHGKCLIDALNGIDKAFLDRTIDTKTAIESTEENDDYEAPKMEIYQVDEEGNRVSAAMWVHKELSSSDRVCGDHSESSKSKKKASQSIMKRTYLHRKVGVANLEYLKKIAVGFEKGDGMKNHYNFVADPLLGIGKIACRRIPCSCSGCREQRKKPTVEERYGPSLDCVLRPIMFDSSKDYNSWKIIDLVDDKTSDREQHKLGMMVSMADYGETVASGVVEGSFGAYIVADDPGYDYYMCQWEGSPFKVEKDELIVPGEGEDAVQVYEGDWICRGVWLEKLPDARNWWTMTDRSCIVRMQEVVHSDVRLCARSESNPLRRGLNPRILQHADEWGAWRLKDDEHKFMMMTRRTMEGMDYADEVFEDAVENMLVDDNESEESEEENDSSSGDELEETSGDESDDASDDE